MTCDVVHNSKADYWC